MRVPPSDDASTPSIDGAPHVIADRYEVLGLLGVGGMGSVYKVRDRELDEVVALKMLKREIANSPGIIERFRREVKLARRVTHPNVARTYDLGEHAGDRFLTMELIDGESLQTTLTRERQLPLARVVDIVSAICAGLQAAHGAGVVHRDLKPDNVMIARPRGSEPERIVITDFGIARTDEGAKRTAVPVGTPAYMSPEQVEAATNIDGRADIYALGAMMFELLTGRLPFEADSVFAVASLRLVQPPPDPRIHRPDLPESVAELVRHCMARRPGDRPQTADEIARRLANLTLPTAEAPAARLVTAGGATANQGRTVAVLPFRNAGTPDDDYVVDGLTDDLIDGLSMTPGLRVRPRGVVMQLKNTSSDPRQVGRELDVQVVIEGSMRAAADSIRVSVRVLSVVDGFQIWAKRFEGARSDVLRIGDDAARAIADALTVHKPTPRAAIMTDAAAVDLYLRGRHEFFKFSREATERAIELLKAAHDRAPNDPLVMSGYAVALGRQLGGDVAGRADTARAIAERAVRIAPQLAEAHVALATTRLHDLDTVRAAAGVSQALALSPLLPDAHDLRAQLLLEVSDPAEALAEATRTMQLEPRLTHIRYAIIGRALQELGEFQSALKEYATPPDDVETANIYWMMWARLLMWQRDASGAAALLTRMAAAKPFEVLFIVRRLCTYVTAGKVDDADLEVLAARARSPNLSKRGRAFQHQMRAEILASVGREREALPDIEAAVSLGLCDVAWLDRCPLLKPLHETEPFRALREEVAMRAGRTLVELRGRDATVASG